MSSLRKFLKEYGPFRERFDWAQRKLEEHDIVQVRMTVGELVEFIDRWQGRVRHPQAELALTELRGSTERMKIILEGIFLEDLDALINKRIDVIMGNELVRTAVHLIQIMKHAPPDLRTKLEDNMRPYQQGRDFDPERQFREAEEGVETNERDYKQALANFEIRWPDRLTSSLRHRLQTTTTAEAFKSWKAELESRDQ